MAALQLQDKEIVEILTSKIEVGEGISKVNLYECDPETQIEHHSYFLFTREDTNSRRVWSEEGQRPLGFWKSVGSRTAKVCDGVHFSQRRYAYWRFKYNDPNYRPEIEDTPLKMLESFLDSDESKVLCRTYKGRVPGNSGVGELHSNKRKRHAEDKEAEEQSPILSELDDYDFNWGPGDDGLHFPTEQFPKPSEEYQYDVSWVDGPSVRLSDDPEINKEEKSVDKK